MIPPHGWNRYDMPPSLAEIVGDIQSICEQTHESIARRNRAQDARNKFYFRLNLERGAEDLELQDWDHVDHLDAAVERQLAREPMKTDVGKLADLLCDQTPGREYHTFHNLSIWGTGEKLR